LNVKYVAGKLTSSTTEDEEEDAYHEETARVGREKRARLIMRTDGVHRVVLNTPVFRGMKVGTVDGGEPSGKTIHLTGMEGGRGVLYILKVSGVSTLQCEIDAWETTCADF